MPREEAHLIHVVLALVAAFATGAGRLAGKCPLGLFSLRNAPRHESRAPPLRKITTAAARETAFPVKRIANTNEPAQTEDRLIVNFIVLAVASRSEGNVL